jgi:predicted nuclease of predicted toxin-antitoxin system
MRKRVLLDEQLPTALRNWLPAVEAFTVEYRGWKGLGDRALLDSARGTIDMPVTFDAALVDECPEWQEICGLVLLDGRNVIPALRTAAPLIETACLDVARGECRRVQVL